MMKVFLIVTVILLSTMSVAALECAEDWIEFDSSCYKVMSTSKHTSLFGWLKALRLCSGFGGNLLSIADESEMKFVNSLPLELKNDSAWIGLLYRFRKGGYLWSDGTPFNYSVYINWLASFDKQSNSSEIQCVELLRNGWNLTDCYQENQYYICERPKGLPPCPADWFLNGLSCYKHNTVAATTWNMAQQNCIESEGSLVQIDGDNEQQFMVNYMHITGLRKLTNYVWTGHQRNMKCVQMATDDGAKDEARCDKLNYFVCEKPVRRTGYSCYQCPGNTLSADITVNCTFPENLCFKHSNRRGIRKKEQVTVQGCMSAEQCRRMENKHLKCCEGDLCNKEISCYQCSSNKSLDDCTKNQEVVDCPIPVHHCMKTEYETKTKYGKLQKSYHKGCTTTDKCKETGHVTVDCCSDDRCNTDLGPRCYECASTATNEECPVRQCIFNHGQCYSAWMWKQQGSNVVKHFKYGCTKKHDCGKTVDKYFIQCCDGSLCNKELPKNSNSIKMIIYVSCGVALILLLLSIAIGFRCYKTLHKEKLSRPERSRREIIPLGKWEILPDQIKYEEELGRGAFGVVRKATFTKRVGIKVFDTGKQILQDPKKAHQIVAVKVLQDDPTEGQKEEFMLEIEQMKLLGSHQNVVSMVGCCTLQEEKFLVIEYVPFGDLLKWLRSRRRMIDKREVSETLYADKDVSNDQEANREFHKENKVIPEQGIEGQIHEKVEMMPLQDIKKVVRENTSPYENLLEKRSDDSRKVEEEQTSCAAGTMNITLSPPRDNEDVVLEMPPSSSCKDDERTKSLEQDSLTIPTTLQGKGQTTARLLSEENLEEDGFKEEDNFSTKQLFSFAWQIAKGMNHLAENDFVHRDLAARNVLVGCDNQVKVSDFGLMRQIYEDVYSSKKTKKLPVKWMAPESLHESTFTTKSDVWAYGVLLWEMATLGGVPYPTLTNTELYRLIKTGYRMERPDMCSDEVYELMSECWKEDPSTRPSFSQLIEKLEVIMQMDVPYCDLGKHDESSLYYNVLPGASAAENST